MTTTRKCIESLSGRKNRKRRRDEKIHTHTVMPVWFESFLITAGAEFIECDKKRKGK